MGKSTYSTSWSGTSRIMSRSDCSCPESVAVAALLATSASAGLVAEDDQAAGARPAVNKSHGCVRTPLTEESFAAAKDHRVQPELILVDELVLHQSPCQTGAAHDENRIAG